MCQLHADIPGNLVAVETVGCLLEQYASLRDPRVVVLIILVQQRARQPVEKVARRIALACFNGVQLHPQFLESGEPVRGQRFHSGIFDHADDGHLPGIERFGRDRFARVHEMGCAVSSCGAV